MSLLYTNVMGANCPGTKVFHCGTPLPKLPSLVLLLLLLQYTNTRQYYHYRSTISVLAEAWTATPIIIVDTNSNTIIIVHEIVSV